MLFAGGILVFHFSAPEGALGRIKGKAVALFSKENPPVPKLDEGEADGAQTEQEGGDVEEGKNGHMADNEDVALPTGLPELPPLDADGTGEDAGETNNEPKGDDEFIVEIVPAETVTE